MANRTRSGRRPDYQWNGATWAQAGQGTTHSLGSGTIVVFNAPGTIMRVRGYASITIDAGAAADSMVLALGLIVANDDLVSAGATAFASPINDLDADWLWHSFFPVHAESATPGDGADHNVQQVIDSKAMRRVKQNDNLAMVIDGQVLAGTPTADAVAGVRVLFSS